MWNTMTIERTKIAIFGILLALSLLLSALPASAGYRHDGLDFIDATGITWERQPKNITWENKDASKKAPSNITWELLRSITWE